ncbi:UNVERIFIED_CONTAM: carboxypeptidase regulatory-like domain-containing protein [Microbacterium sp. SLM126]
MSHTHSRPPRIRRAIAALTAIAVAGMLAVVGVAPAHAADAVATITKALDSTQGAGFSAPNTFEAGSLVRYRIAYQCASLTDPCVTGQITDVLDPRLEFVQVIVPSGSTTTVTSSYDAATHTVTADISNFQDGTGGELILIARVAADAPAGVIPNDAAITIPDAGPVVTPEVEIVVPAREPDWSITKHKTSPVGSPAVDNEVTYHLDLHANATVGNVPINAGTIVDTFPDGAIVVNADGGVVDYSNNTITWTVGVITVADGWDADITLVYPSDPRAPGEPVFTPSQTVLNMVDASVTYENGDPGSHHAEAPVTLVGPTPEIGLGKTGTATASPGSTISWKVEGSNPGNTTLVNPIVTDSPLPVGVEGLTIYAAPGTPQSPQFATVYEQFVGGAWIPLASYDGLSSMGTVALDPAATGIRAYPASGLAAPNTTFGEIYLTGTVAEDATGTISNCATVAADGGLTLQPQCANTTVSADSAALTVLKLHELPDPAVVTVQPGDTFAWAFGVFADVSQGPVTTLTITDVLPAGFTYQGVLCAGFWGVGGGYEQGVRDGCNAANVANVPDLPPVVITENIDGLGSTGLTWNIDLSDGTLGATTMPASSIFLMHLEIVANDGLPIGSYTNDVLVSAPDQPTVCRPGTVDQADALDIDGDGDTTEVVCFDDDAIEVAAAAIVSGAKYDDGADGLEHVDQTTGQPNADCPDVDGYTRYPCVAQTTPGGPLSYRFALTNIGNVDATNYVMYDVLPHIDDTGVSETLSGVDRGTEWVPVLTGPVIVLDAPAAAAPLVEYNLTSNPCRPELNEGSTDADWQGACNDMWFTAAEITNWSTVKSFRVSAFTPVDGEPAPAWEPLESMLLQADLRAPVSAPQSTQSPLDLSIAWNSFAHREFRLNGDGTMERLLPSEPRKVGIIVPFVLPDVYAVGDYVWFDDDKDGVQDAAEEPVPGVTVTLLDEDGNVALDSNGFAVAPTITDANGHYVFDNLAAGTYTVRFSDLPEGYETTAQNNAGNQSGTDDSNVPADLTGTATTPSFSLGESEAGMTPVVASDGTTLAVAINRTIDAGITLLPPLVYAVGDYVWYDGDRDGLQDSAEEPVAGVTVTLLTADGDPVLDADGVEVAPTVTDAAGHYVFDNLLPGTYKVVFSDLPDGFETTSQNESGDQAEPDDSNTPAGETTTSETPVFTLGATEPGMAPVEESDGTSVAVAINRTIDAGLVAVLYAVGDYVWIDRDRDGVQDDGEEPVAGVTVELLNPDGDVIATTTTDSDGHYVFDGVPAGDYRVRFSELPDGFKTTAQNTGGDQTAPTDSNVPAGLTSIATTPVFSVGGAEPGMDTIVPGDGVTIGKLINRTIDAGLVAIVYAIGDFVWIDADRDGVQDANESPVAGITVTLLGADGSRAIDADGNPVPDTVTDANGHYVFDNLPAGEYQVQFSDIPGKYTTTEQNNAGDQTSTHDSNVPSGRVLIAITPVFTIGADEAGTEPVQESDGTELADYINRTIDMGLVLQPLVPTPPVPTPPGLANTGGVVGGTAAIAVALLGAGLLLVLMRRRSARRAEQ